ncbi:ABC transporter permease [Rhizobium sp. XQZ8]|uniref:ABC transporter permease n=1 Tax=Rhizobium populisoli TaxID=2859785 RepID=UPI001C67FEB9|nr:ABC transporter permease [Rhizobium populisoli]MBW6425870.1 ABC transporter permease [Rhizobium populisoli]
MSAVPSPERIERGQHLRELAAAAAGPLVSILIAFVGLLVIIFFMGRILPIDPVLAIVGDQADASTYQQVAREMGYDKPIVQQFLIYVRDALSGDFGRARLTGNLVWTDILSVFPATVELATAAILIGAILGIPLGVTAAVNRGKPLDHILRVVMLMGHSAPIFWLGLIGLIVFYATLQWVGGSGQLSLYNMDIVPRVTGFILIDSLIAGEVEIFQDAVNHLILPAGILGYGSTAFIGRMTRSFMLDQLTQEYVTAARVKGLSRRQVIWNHAFRNIRVQLLTVLALAYGGLLEGTVLIESVFSWPGLGQYFTNALLIGDMNAVMASTLVIGSIFLGLNLLTDIFYKILDPRTR